MKKDKSAARTIAEIVCVLGLMIVAFCGGFSNGRYFTTKHNHHDYVRTMELKIADLDKSTELKIAELEGKIEQLENTGIEIHIVDHTGLWNVMGANYYPKLVFKGNEVKETE